MYFLSIFYRAFVLNGKTYTIGESVYLPPDTYKFPVKKHVKSDKSNQPQKKEVVRKYLRKFV